MSLSQPKPQRLTDDEARALLALDEQFAETRRGSTTMIVLAACNARDAADQDRMMVALAGLRRRHLVNLRGDRWMPTPEGIEAARQQRAAKPGRKRKPEPPDPPPPRTIRDSLRPRQHQHTSPKPVTRPVPDSRAQPQTAPATDLMRCRHCGVQFRRPDEAPIPDDICVRCHEAHQLRVTHHGHEACEGCGSVAGQYHAPECPVVDAFTAGRIQGDGSGQALPAIEYPATVERLAPPMSVELLHRCAAMQLALLAQVQRAHARGEPGADRELTWLIETGRQLVAAGGAHGKA